MCGFRFGILVEKGALFLELWTKFLGQINCYSILLIHVSIFCCQYCYVDNVTKFKLIFVYTKVTISGRVVWKWDNKETMSVGENFTDKTWSCCPVCPNLWTRLNPNFKYNTKCQGGSFKTFDVNWKSHKRLTKWEIIDIHSRDLGHIVNVFGNRTFSSKALERNNERSFWKLFLWKFDFQMTHLCDRKNSLNWIRNRN